MADESAKILVIEDEDQVRESYLEMFSFFGYDVESVPNGREGLACVNKEDYDIVITDLNMPEMDGIEVLKYIKKRKPYIEVIVITGYATLENAVKAMKVGAYDYFTKPIDIDHVRIILSKCIKQLRAKRENAELKSLNEKLKDLNEMKDKFITLTNHELRTPVTVLKGYIELIDYFLQDTKNVEVNEAINIVTETMKELVSIVDQMHDISSFDYGKDNLLRTDIDMRKLIMLIYKEMRVLYEKRKINLQINFDGPSVTVHGDYNRIKRSIRELLQNALKFTPEGGRVSLLYAINGDNKNLRIKVEDNGIGIPHEKQSLVFEPFYEVQNVINHMTSKTEFMGGGIGLGLTLAKEVFESHQGTLLLESEENSGSTFTAVIPFQQILAEN